MLGIKRIILFIILLVVSACNSKDPQVAKCTCFDLEESIFIPFIGINKKMLNDNCVYYLKSLSIEPPSRSPKRLCYDSMNLKIMVGYPFKNYDVIYSRNDTIGTERGFIYSEKSSFNCSGIQCYDNVFIDVRLEDKIYRNDVYIKVLKFYNFKMRGAEDLNNIVLTVFFSDSKGFIGCYLYQSTKPRVIFGIQGDILKDSIDYSDYSFHKLG